MCSGSLVPRGRVEIPLILYSNRVLLLFVLTMGITLRSLQDKHWLFILFLLLLPFQRANRMLTVNFSTGARLLLVSGNAKSCKYPDQSPTFSCPMKCKQEANCKYLTWSPSISCLKIMLMAKTDTHYSF